MWKDPQEYITYEFVLTFPAVSRIFGKIWYQITHKGWYAIKPNNQIIHYDDKRYLCVFI